MKKVKYIPLKCSRNGMKRDSSKVKVSQIGTFIQTQERRTRKKTENGILSSMS